MAMEKHRYLTTDQEKISHLSLGRSSTLALKNGIIMALISVQAVVVILGIGGVVASLFNTLISKWP